SGQDLLERLLRVGHRVRVEDGPSSRPGEPLVKGGPRVLPDIPAELLERGDVVPLRPERGSDLAPVLRRVRDRGEPDVLPALPDQLAAEIVGVPSGREAHRETSG